MLSDRRTFSLGVTSMGHLGRTQKSQAASEKKLKAYACELEQKLEARTRELAESRRHLSEAREQLAATSEVLGVISSSPSELKPVFDAMLANAVRICEAKFGNLYLHEGGALRVVASHNMPRAFAEARRRGPIHPAPGGDFAKLIRTKRTVQTADLAATRPYAERVPAVVDAVELGGVRTVVVVPMLKNNDLVGAIAIFRQEVRPFTDKQIELVEQLCKAGRHRDREHAPAQRAAPAHGRPHRVAAAADGDVGGAASYLQLARRAGAGVRGDAGERYAPVRGQFWKFVSARRRGVSPCRAP